MPEYNIEPPPNEPPEQKLNILSVEKLRAWLELAGVLMVAAVGLGVFVRLPLIVERNQEKNDASFVEIKTSNLQQFKDINATLETMRLAQAAHGIRFDYMQKDIGRLDGAAQNLRSDVDKINARQIEIDVLIRNMSKKELLDYQKPLK